MFGLAVEQVAKINRAIQQPYSNAIVVGVEGQGKMALARLAVFVCGYACHELPGSKEFDLADWQTNLKEMIRSAALAKRTAVLNIQEDQITDDALLADLDCLLKNGFLPGLLLPAEHDIICQPIAASLSPGQRSSGVPQATLLRRECKNRVMVHVKAILNLTPAGRILRSELRHYRSLLSTSTLIWMADWPEEGYRKVGKLHLELYVADDEFEATLEAAKVTQPEAIV